MPRGRTATPPPTPPPVAPVSSSGTGPIPPAQQDFLNSSIRRHNLGQLGSILAGAILGGGGVGDQSQFGVSPAKISEGLSKLSDSAFAGRRSQMVNDYRAERNLQLKQEIEDEVKSIKAMRGIKPIDKLRAIRLAKERLTEKAASDIRSVERAAGFGYVSGGFK